MIEVYLNPVNDYLNIDLTGNDESMAILNIFNTEDQLVYSEKLNIDNKQEINIGRLQPGIYNVKVKTENHVYNKKINKLSPRDNANSVNINDMYFIVYLLFTYLIFFLISQTIRY